MAAENQLAMMVSSLVPLCKRRRQFDEVLKTCIKKKIRGVSVNQINTQLSFTKISKIPEKGDDYLVFAILRKKYNKFNLRR